MESSKNKQSDKGKLIKKYCEHVSLEEVNNDVLGHKQRGRGIYVLYNHNEVYYIGLSKFSLRARLKKHATEDRLKGKWNNFSFYKIGKTKYIKDIESLLLRVYRPSGNRVVGKLKKGANLALMPTIVSK